MRRIKKDHERRVRVSITIDPTINNILENICENKSKYIDFALLEYFSRLGLDISKIKL